MSESTLLITAGTSMLVLSLLVAGVLFWLNANPLWVATGGTVAGIAVYVAFCVIGRFCIRKDFALEEKQDA